MPRKPTKSIEETAEDALIGAIFKLGMNGIDTRLTHEDFHQPAVCSTFRASLSLSNSGAAVNPESVAGESARLGLVPLDVGILRQLAQDSSASSERDIERLSGEVVRLSQMRRIGLVCRDIAAQAGKLAGSPESLVDSLQGQLVRLGSSDSNVRDSRDVCWEVAESAARRITDNVKPGFAWSLPELDAFGIRWLPGKQYIVAARPGVGKTSFALGEIISGSSQGVLLLCSAEMTSEEMAQKELSYRTGVPANVISYGVPTLEQADRMIRCADTLTPGRVYINDMVSGIAGIRSHARRLRSQCDAKGIPFLGVVVDYLQLICGFGNSREQSISEVSGGLKRLAVELRCTTVVLSQLNRDTMKREDKRPQLHDLRESGSIEQDADSVVFIYRENEVNPNAPEDKAEIIIAKNRGGPKGTVECLWDGARTRFLSNKFTPREANQNPANGVRKAPGPGPKGTGENSEGPTSVLPF